MTASFQYNGSIHGVGKANAAFSCCFLWIILLGAFGFFCRNRDRSNVRSLFTNFLVRLPGFPLTGLGAVVGLLARGAAILGSEGIAIRSITLDERVTDGTAFSAGDYNGAGHDGKLLVSTIRVLHY
jgi:hypothetical protein